MLNEKAAELGHVFVGQVECTLWVEFLLLLQVGVVSDPYGVFGHLPVVAKLAAVVKKRVILDQLLSADSVSLRVLISSPRSELALVALRILHRHLGILRSVHVVNRLAAGLDSSRFGRGEGLAGLCGRAAHAGLALL